MSSSRFDGLFKYLFIKRKVTIVSVLDLFFFNEVNQVASSVSVSYKSRNNFQFKSLFIINWKLKEKTVVTILALFCA